MQSSTKLRLRDALMTVCDVRTVTAAFQRKANFGRQLHLVEALEVLQSTGWSCSAQELINSLRPQKPRLYSISSSPHHGPRCSVCVAVLKYWVAGRCWKGVTTGWLERDIVPGSRLPVFIQQNESFRLPPRFEKPTIMIGPGTGIAPFRAFIQEQERRRDAETASPSQPSKHVLFFGCRKRDEDFLYADELGAWDKSGIIQLHVAFSRETGSKVYVQHLLQRHSDFLWRLLEEGAHIYVCGDASMMARDVHETLQRIIADKESCSISAAESQLQEWMSRGRYQRDIWS